jgi:DNA-directed RNA polymerase subunit RPC12/RpoP
VDTLMSIAVTCRCGQKFNAKDELAGKTVKCPKCAQPLTISGPGSSPPKERGAPPSQAPAKPTRSLDSVFDEVGLTMRSEGTECPECGHMLPVEAVLCVNCGYDFKHKRRLQTLGTTNAPVVKNPERKKLSATEKMLLHAEDELEKEPVTQDQGYGSRSSAWLVAMLMLLIAGAAVAGGIAFFNYMEGEADDKPAASSKN